MNRNQQIYLVRSLSTQYEKRDLECLENLTVKLGELSIDVIDPAKCNIPKTEPEKRYIFCMDAVRTSRLLVAYATEKLGFGAGVEVFYGNRPANPNTPPYSTGVGIFNISGVR